MSTFTSTALGIASLVGLGTTVAGQVMAGQAQERQGREMAAAERLNADIARQNAEAIRTAGAYEIEKAKDNQRRFVGRQRALIAKSGVKFSGSPLDTISDTIANFEMDNAITNYNTNIAASRAMSQANYSDYLANSYKTQGQISSNESLFKAGTTLLTSGSNWSNKYAGAFKYKPSLSIGGK